MTGFTDADWKVALSHLAKVLGPAADAYAANPAARLFAAIPYLAGSEDPDRFALSNLLTFHAAVKDRELFDHRQSDDEDVFRRLAAFHVGNHADPKVVDHGLTLLALISLNDHVKDLEADKLSGEEQKKLADQLSELQEKLKRLTDQKEKKDQLQKDFEDGKINQDQLDRELAELKQEAQGLEELDDLAEMLGQCKECLGAGNSLKAGQRIAVLVTDS